MHTIHINLVSEQLIPNIIPTFSDEKCEEVVLVLGDKTHKPKAETLAQIYQDRGLCVLMTTEGTSSHRPHLLHQQAEQLIDWLQKNHKDKRWILNATCGTKPMALVFASAFNRYNSNNHENTSDGIPRAIILYADTQNHEIPLLNDGVDFALPWKAVLKLDEILTANGFESQMQIDRDNHHDILKRSKLTRYLGKAFQKECRYFLGSLQGAANQAQKDSDNRGELKRAPNQHAEKMCLKLQENNLLNWTPEQSKVLYFNDKNACRYLAGGWLEELTYLTALECGFDEVAMSVEGIWKSEPIKADNERGKNNEFDVLICHNNQIVIIECKAKHWGDFQDGESTNQDVVLKLESLGRKLGGYFGERLLISARQLPDDMAQRASDNRISVCHMADASSILNKLEQYKQKMQKTRS